MLLDSRIRLPSARCISHITIDLIRLPFLLHQSVLIEYTHNTWGEYFCFAGYTLNIFVLLDIHLIKRKEQVCNNLFISFYHSQFLRAKVSFVSLFTLFYHKMYNVHKSILLSACYSFTFVVSEFKSDFLGFSVYSFVI